MLLLVCPNCCWFVSEFCWWLTFVVGLSIWFVDVVAGLSILLLVSLFVVGLSVLWDCL